MLNYKQHEVVKYEMDTTSNDINDMYDYNYFGYDWQPMVLAPD